MTPGADEAAGEADAPVAMPVKRFVAAPVAAAAIIGCALAAGAALARPAWLGSIGLGAGSAAIGVAVGALAIAPWKPRARAVWPTLVLASHGISMAALLASAGLLYSAAQPDAVAFVVSAVLPFPIAMIAQAKLALAPTLSRPATVGSAP